MTEIRKIAGKPYLRKAIFRQKTYAKHLAEINRVRGFSVRITEEDRRGKCYVVWARQSKAGYAIDWISLKQAYYNKTGRTTSAFVNRNGTEMD